MNKRFTEIAPEDVLLDQANLPSFDKTQLEGKLIKSVDSGVFYGLSFAVVAVVCVFIYAAYGLQVNLGEEYAQKAENNRFESVPIFAPRGAIYDRNNVPLAWNQTKESTAQASTSMTAGTNDLSDRLYVPDGGFGNLLGYIRFPRKDKYGVYITKNAEPVGGVEEYYNKLLSGKAGSLYIETNAVGKVISETQADFPLKGTDLHLTIDSVIQKQIYDSIKKATIESGYVGGVGLVVDVTDGSMLAAVTYPDFNANIMTTGTNTQAIQAYLNDKRSVFLHRYTNGLYTPGSIVKPMFALAGLSEGVVTPAEKILSTGSLSVPNPYQPGKFTTFKDWKAHGYTNVREAIAVSSDVYFYTIGGGVPGKLGLGITKLAEYAHMFGLDEQFADSFFASKGAVIPTPEWKKRVFDGDEWRLGDTYNSSIGQYGFSVTPVQVLSMITTIAREGDKTPMFKITAEEPTRMIDTPKKVSTIEKKYYDEVHEGMRLTVTAGTAQALNFKDLKLAGKTGTAQTGVGNSYFNSWFVGFWPYTNPRYAIVYLLEKAPSSTTKGASFYVRDFVKECAAYQCDIIHRVSLANTVSEEVKAQIETEAATVTPTSYDNR